MTANRWSASLFVAALLGLFLGIGAANAHAQLEHAEPKVGNTVKSPRAVSLWFTQSRERG